VNRREELLRRHAGIAFEEPLEVKPAQADMRRDLIERWLVRAMLDEVVDRDGDALEIVHHARRTRAAKHPGFALCTSMKSTTLFSNVEAIQPPRSFP
jgi:hypothetical protein